MELSWKQRDSRWNPGWNSDRSKGIQDGAQMEAKEAKGSEMESQMELSWKRRKPRLTPKIESKQSK